jgi:hypothetical protein
MRIVNNTVMPSGCGSRWFEQRADGHAHGRLRNRPARLVGIDIGDLVPFEPENVIAIEHTDEELGYAQDDWAVIDRAAIEQDRAPDIVARAAGPYSADQDAWWMILREQPAGPRIEGVNGLTDRFPDLAEPLRCGAGLWELTDGMRERARWRLVPDTEVETSEEWQRFLAGSRILRNTCGRRQHPDHTTTASRRDSDSPTAVAGVAGEVAVRGAARVVGAADQRAVDQPHAALGDIELKTRSSRSTRSPPGAGSRRAELRVEAGAS